jgi:hypothetical protein
MECLRCWGCAGFRARVSGPGTRPGRVGATPEAVITRAAGRPRVGESAVSSRGLVRGEGSQAVLDQVVPGVSEGGERHGVQDHCVRTSSVDRRHVDRDVRKHPTTGAMTLPPRNRCGPASRQMCAVQPVGGGDLSGASSTFLLCGERAQPRSADSPRLFRGDCRLSVSDAMSGGTSPPRSSESGGVAHTRLLDDSVRTGVWPDSVQVIGGKLSMRLPTR